MSHSNLCWLECLRSMLKMSVYNKCSQFLYSSVFFSKTVHIQSKMNTASGKKYSNFSREIKQKSAFNEPDQIGPDTRHIHPLKQGMIRMLYGNATDLVISTEEQLLLCAPGSVVCLHIVLNMCCALSCFVGFLKCISMEENSRNTPLFYLSDHQNICSKQEMCLEAHLTEQKKMNW